MVIKKLADHQRKSTAIALVAITLSVITLFVVINKAGAKNAD